jgi:hypothetical protein
MNLIKVRYISEVLIIIICVIILALQGKEIHGQGFKEFLANLVRICFKTLKSIKLIQKFLLNKAGEPGNVFYTLFCILVLLAIPFRFVTLPTEVNITARNVEDTFVILAIPCAWMHLLFYARYL